MCALRNEKVHLTKENDSSRKPSTTVSTSRSEGEKLMGRSLYCFARLFNGEI